MMAICPPTSATNRGLDRPAGYQDVVPQLGRAGVLPADLVERLSGMAGPRNILVDDYLVADHGRMFDDLTAGLSDFEDFARAVEAVVSPREQVRALPSRSAESLHEALNRALDPTIRVESRAPVAQPDRAAVF